MSGTPGSLVRNPRASCQRPRGFLLVRHSGASCQRPRGLLSETPRPLVRHKNRKRAGQEPDPGTSWQRHRACCQRLRGLWSEIPWLLVRDSGVSCQRHRGLSQTPVGYKKLQRGRFCSGSTKFSALQKIVGGSKKLQRLKGAWATNFCSGH